MKRDSCSFEVRVIAAARSGSWTDALRDHAAACASCRETLDVLPAMQRLATETVAPIPPPFAAIRLRAEFARRQQLRRRHPVQTYVPTAVAAVLVAGLFWWIGAPPQDVVRESIELASSASRVFTGGLGLAIFLGFAMLAFVLMEEGRER